MRTFEELYDMYNGPIYRFAWALTGDARDAEDLFQETWLRAARSFRPAPDSGASPEGAKAWLFIIASNVHRDALRKKRIRRAFFLERTRSLAAASTDGDFGWDRAGMPQRAGGTTPDVRACLRKAIARLPGRERRVFVLKDIEGFKHAEISRLLGIPEPTVRTLLYRAVRRLQRDLSEFRPAARKAVPVGEGQS